MKHREYNTDDDFDIFFSKTFEKFINQAIFFFSYPINSGLYNADEEKISEDHELKEIV